MNYCTDIVSIVDVLCPPRIAVFRCASISSTMLGNVQLTFINVFKILSPIVSALSKPEQRQRQECTSSATIWTNFGLVY